MTCLETSLGSLERNEEREDNQIDYHCFLLSKKHKRFDFLDRGMRSRRLRKHMRSKLISKSLGLMQTFFAQLSSIIMTY